MHSSIKTPDLSKLRQLSPLRNTTDETSLDSLVHQQLEHFGISAKSPLRDQLFAAIHRVYECYNDIEELWKTSQSEMANLNHDDKIALFNAKKFLSFQLAKALDELQNPFRKNYQHLNYDQATLAAKSSYPIFDNVTAVFSATPAITRTATYIYACAEWIEDAFNGRELMLEIYSRLLNPTSISLANHIVDLEAGEYSGDYLAWNFNSGMAAIDATLSHVLGYQDILIVGQNIYGGAHQLIYDWYARSSNLDIGIECMRGDSGDDFLAAWNRVQQRFGDRLKTKRVYLYLESPCNPHGYVLDVPTISQLAHQRNVRVILDATVGTPFLHRPLQTAEVDERPDFVIHSYTKDLSGHGTVVAGCVIARNEDMFIPKGNPGWQETMFWNVYYIKGAFLSADAAFEVLQGMRTLETRMLKKCINTLILAKFMAAHPAIQVNCNGLEDDSNHHLCEKNLLLGLPAPLFTVDFGELPRPAFQRFFDLLEPAFSHMISLGQTNSIVSCPGLTTHSELDPEQQRQAKIFPTTIRFSIGTEQPMDLIFHLIQAAKLAIDPIIADFSKHFMDRSQCCQLIADTYTDSHRRYVEWTLRGEKEF